MTSRPYCPRFARIAWIAGRSGARPTPPATIRTSAPTASPTGQALPNGPRTPTTPPFFSRCRPLVTEPQCPDRVHQPLGMLGVAGDADRHLADAEQIKHVELAGGEREGGNAVLRPQHQGEGIAEVLRHPFDQEGTRLHRVMGNRYRHVGFRSSGCP